MNLYLFNASDSAAMYGIGTYLNELTHALQGAGINIHILHLHSSRPEFETVSSTVLADRTVRQNELTDKVENWYIPEVRNCNTFTGSVKNLEGYCRNVAYLLRIHIKDTRDLVFHFNFNQYAFLAGKLKTFFECKTVHTVHFMKWAFELQGNMNLFHQFKTKPESERSRYEKLLYDTDEYEGRLYRETDRVIALSQNMKNLLCSEYQLSPDKVSVIPNGLKDLHPQTETEKAVLRRKWRIAEKELLILFTGRFHAVKGLVFLIKAFRKVLEKIPDCRLMIAGNGNYDLFVREARDICTKVTFTGFLEKNGLYELYRIADAGVVPSLYEPFGYVAVEMMMHGLPVVATATSGLNEVVNDACGIKVPVTERPGSMDIDTALLAEKIVYLLQHPSEAKKMGQNGRKRYLEEYSSEVFRRNMIEFYQSLNK